MGWQNILDHRYLLNKVVSYVSGNGQNIKFLMWSFREKSLLYFNKFKPNMERLNDQNAKVIDLIIDSKIMDYKFSN